jgi:two-component system sensor histidine kinase VicK
MTDNPFNLPENLFQILFEKSLGSILVKADAPRFTVLAASDAYLKITSAIRDEVLGKGFFDVFPDINDDPFDDTTARRVFKKVIKTHKKVDIPVYRYDVFDAETNKRLPHYWSCSNIPIFDTDNKVAYILNTVVDITGEVKAKEAAIESENRLLLAADATGLAIWDLYIKEVNFTYSPQLIELFGHRPGFDINLSIIRNQIHPDDMENIVLKAYYESLLTGNFSYEIRIFWPDDSLHWIRVKGKVLFDEKKEPARMIGTVVDTTESKRDEIRKNDFIAMASHELKTPLTSLTAYIQLLAAKLADSSDPFTNNALLKAGNQVNKMTALVHSFLDLSKLEPGKIQLKRQNFEITKLIEETIAESRLITNTHNILFEPFEEINIDADREKIGQVISNLINNAVKYSPKGSTITLCCEPLDGYIRIAVTDQGIGIKLKDQEKIFQRFYRVDDKEMQSVSGFGIGLYLSSEIIQRHKGKIWVNSKEGKGSTFYFTLPLNA